MPPRAVNTGGVAITDWTVTAMTNSTALLLESPERLDEIRIHIGSFLAAQQSPETVKAYRHDLKVWVTWCATHDVHPYDDIRRTHVELYMRELEQRDLANATRSRKLAALSSWFWWMVDEGIIEANPAHRVKRPRRHHGPKPSLSRSQAADYMDAAEARGPDTGALIHLMLLQGMRVGTVVRIDVQGVTNDRYQPAVTVISKGDKMITHPLVPRAMEQVELCIDGRTRGPLLRNDHGNRMTYSNARYRVRRLCEQAGMRKVSPHALRRTFARLADAEGTPLHAIQQAMNHSDPKTTVGYLEGNLSTYEHPSFNVMTVTAR